MLKRQGTVPCLYPSKAKANDLRNALYLITRMLTMGSLIALFFDYATDGNPYKERIVF